MRQAFLRTIPRKAIVQKDAGGFQDEPSSRDSFLIFPGSTGYASAITQNGSSQFADVDIAGAKGLLKTAHDPHPTVCILYDTTNSVRTAEFELIKASATKAGFRITSCGTADWQTALRTAGAYDASLFSWRSTTSAVTAAAPRLQSGDGPQNYSYFSDPQVDALLGTLATTSATAGQVQLETQIDRRLFADGYGLPLYQEPALTAFRSTVSGIRRSPFAPGVFWNVWEWRPAS